MLHNLWNALRKCLLDSGRRWTGGRLIMCLLAGAFLPVLLWTGNPADALDVRAAMAFTMSENSVASSAPSTVPTFDAEPEQPGTEPELPSPIPVIEATASPSPLPSVTPKPWNVTMKQTGKKMKLSWKRVSGAVKYQVEVRQTGGSWKKYKKTKKKSFMLKCSAGKTYKIRVRAYGKNNKTLSISKEQSCFIPKRTSRIHAFYGSSSKAELSWNPVKKASYYLVYRKKGKGSYRKIKRTGKCEYTDRALSGGSVYRYQVKAVYRKDRLITMGRAAVRVYDNRKVVATNHQKYSYGEMVSDIFTLARKYPGVVHYQTIGKSEDGRNIYDVVLGSRNASKSILVISTLHAREYMASLLCMNQIEYYARNYREKRNGESMGSVFSRVCIHYIPMANPDGVSISQYGIHSIQNKKLQKKFKKISKGVNTSRWKANARGVDLNSNFPYQFRVRGTAGSSGYSGIKAASSREAKSIVNRIKQLKGYNLKAVVNYHAMGSIVFGSCNGLSGRVASKTTEMYTLARKTTGYSSAAAYSSRTGSSGSGSLREYIMYNMNLPSITLEIGRKPCPGPISEFSRIWRENADLLYQEAKLF